MLELTQEEDEFVSELDNLSLKELENIFRDLAEMETKEGKNIDTLEKLLDFMSSDQASMNDVCTIASSSTSIVQDRLLQASTIREAEALNALLTRTSKYKAFIIVIIKRWRRPSSALALTRIPQIKTLSTGS
ncbi:MAG: hypothetical protein KKD11_00400 [Candidatus Omnitrophica bacterium]|nr:hypothetical protein [Candidatus Omnitrophota bacterium]